MKSDEIYAFIDKYKEDDYKEPDIEEILDDDEIPKKENDFIFIDLNMMSMQEYEELTDKIEEDEEERYYYLPSSYVFHDDELTQYIQNLGFDYIEVLVLTHPHDDHMGGTVKVINNLEVGIVYGPDIFSIKSLDTIGWYNDMLEAIDSIDLERNKWVDEDTQTSIWHFPRDEDGNFKEFYIGQAFVKFYAPLKDEYTDLNDYLICAKVSFGEFDILLTGDATSKVEKELLLQNYNLQSEVFHSAHHGSNTGNSKAFLEAINPENIVISCGMRNRYNHPVESVMDLYEQMNIPVYRTDESGSIVLTTDGTTYSFNTVPGTYISGAEYNEKGE